MKHDYKIQGMEIFVRVLQSASEAVGEEEVVINVPIKRGRMALMVDEASLKQIKIGNVPSRIGMMSGIIQDRDGPLPAGMALVAITEMMELDSAKARQARAAFLRAAS
jgi:hypothetical protein